MAGGQGGAAMRRRTSNVRQAQAYLKYRRALGFDLTRGGEFILQFAKFLDQSKWQGPLTADVIWRWVNLPKPLSRSYKVIRFWAIRSFTRYLAARDCRSQVPDWRVLPAVQRHRPYIFTERQLVQILRAAGRMKPDYPLLRLTYQTLFGLLATTGLRISEAEHLTRRDVDMDRSLLRINQTKFKKSRWVPLHPTVTKALRSYADKRDSLWGTEGHRPFFVGGTGSAIPAQTVRYAFLRLCRRLGWRRGNGELPLPRVHDLRHSFACRRLLKWYRQGENVHHRIASLATYLGHTKVTGTYWYLTGTPDLLGIMGRRFENFAAPKAGRRV
jgi:integrase